MRLAEICGQTGSTVIEERVHCTRDLLGLFAELSHSRKKMYTTQPSSTIRPHISWFAVRSVFCLDLYTIELEEVYYAEQLSCLGILP